LKCNCSQGTQETNRKVIPVFGLFEESERSAGISVANRRDWTSRTWKLTRENIPRGNILIQRGGKKLQKLSLYISVDLVKRLNTELRSRIRFSAVGFVSSVAPFETAVNQKHCSV
jgi:hypothetical protein